MDWGFAIGAARGCFGLIHPRFVPGFAHSRPPFLRLPKDIELLFNAVERKMRAGLRVGGCLKTPIRPSIFSGWAQGPHPATGSDHGRVYEPRSPGKRRSPRRKRISPAQSEVHHIEEPRERGAPEILEPPRRGSASSPSGRSWARSGPAPPAPICGAISARKVYRIDPQLLAFAATVILLPPLLFIAAAFALARALTLSDTARQLAAVSNRLTEADEGAVQNAQRLGRAVRRELDALSAGLDGAFGRFRALETALEERVAQLEDAGARAGVRADTIAQRLHSEREGIEDLATRLDEAAARAAEILAGRTAQLKTIIEDAGGELKAAGQTLDAQVAQFRNAAENAARAPQAAAIELDRQAKEIANAGEAAAARAEFVLARQERQRVAMAELLARLKEEAEAFDGVMQTQRNGVEMAANVLTGEAQRLDEIAAAGLRRFDAAMIHAGAVFADQAQRLDEITESGLRRLDETMAQAAARSAQLAAGFGNDANRVKEVSDGAASGIARLVESLREAATSAHALFADSTESAKRRSIEFVGEAMAQCDSLLRAAASVAEEAEKARATLSRAAEDAERHIVALPGVAQQEAQRVRETVRAETELMLDISARAITTLQARSSRRRPPEQPVAQAEAESAPESTGEGLRGLARRITAPKRRIEERATDRPRGTYELSAVLAAADAGTKPGLRPGAAGRWLRSRRRWPILPAIWKSWREKPRTRLCGGGTSMATAACSRAGSRHRSDRNRSIASPSCIARTRAFTIRRKPIWPSSKPCWRARAKATATGSWPPRCSPPIRGKSTSPLPMRSDRLE